MEDFIILDFETTGLYPGYSRVIEVGALLVKHNKVVKRLSQLMNPGFDIPDFITDITGITDEMVRGQPKPEKFMPVLKRFIGKRPILAHNARFDQGFLVSEMNCIGQQVTNPFLCTLKLSRRLIPNAPNHKLPTLIKHLKIKMPKTHQAHRALNDVLSTFHLWTHLTTHVLRVIDEEPDFKFFSKLEKYPKHKMQTFWSRYGVC